MDLRKKKTLRAISAAFIKLRSQKDLEQITVTELALAAEISKATFYLHYRDIYDLSGKLQKSALQTILAGLDDPMELLTDSTAFMRKLVSLVTAETETFLPLFSGSQASALPLCIEEGLRERIFQRAPQLENDPQFNVYLSYYAYGGYYAYIRNIQSFDAVSIFDAMEKIYSSPNSISSDSIGKDS